MQELQWCSACVHVCISTCRCKYFFHFLLLPGLEKFVKHCTGGIVVRKKSIQLAFDLDAEGVIRVSTCLRKLILPQNVFTDFESLKSALDSVVEGADFNSV